MIFQGFFYSDSSENKKTIGHLLKFCEMFDEETLEKTKSNTLRT